MKLKNITYAIITFIGLVFLELIGAYIYENYKSIEVSENISENLKVHFIDVGQGDSIFIELPDLKTVLIDAGENIYGEKVTNYIKKLRYKKIDYLFATHPHSDHIGGLESIIDNFDVGSIYMPEVTSNSTLYLNLLKKIDNKNKKIKIAIASKNVILTDDLNLKILAPSGKTYEDINNYSIVLKLTYKEKSFLFMSDASYDSEMDLLNSKFNLKADVLKVGHHGSTSSTNYNFLNAVDPKIAIISVGENNDYGHPKEKILNKLKNKNIKIYRTDLNGNIVVTTNGKMIRMKVDYGSNS